MTRRPTCQAPMRRPGGPVRRLPGRASRDRCRFPGVLQSQWSKALRVLSFSERLQARDVFVGSV